MDNTKICTVCGNTLPLTDFYKEKRVKDGRYAKCKKCHIEITQGRFNANKEKHRNYGRVKSLKRKMKLVKKFGGKCACCGFDDWRALQIDHINGGGSRHRSEFKSGNSYVKYLLELSGEEIGKSYQMLCANCNWIKRYENKELLKK